MRSNMRDKGTLNLQISLVRSVINIECAIYEKGKVLPGDLKFVLDRAESSRGNFSINPPTSLPTVRLGPPDLVFPGQ